MPARRLTAPRGARSPGFVLRALLGVLVAVAVAFGAGGAAASASARMGEAARSATTLGQGAPTQLEGGRVARTAHVQPSKASRASVDGDAPTAALPSVVTSRRAWAPGDGSELAGPPAEWERPSYPTRDRARLMVFTN